MIIGGMTVAAMVSDLRKTVNAWASADELGTGIRTPNVNFEPWLEIRQ